MKATKLLKDTFGATHQVGLGGNHYAVSVYRDDIVIVCNAINKSTRSIYFNKKYQLWAIRIKNNTHKQKLLELIV
jgi:hypothetical protein